MRPVLLSDLAIQAELVVKREEDLGGPCSENEIKRFCREAGIAAGFAAVRPSTSSHDEVAKRARITRKATVKQSPSPSTTPAKRSVVRAQRMQSRRRLRPLPTSKRKRYPDPGLASPHDGALPFAAIGVLDKCKVSRYA